MRCVYLSSLTIRLDYCPVNLLNIRTHRLVDLGIDRYLSTKLSYIAHRCSDNTTELPLPVVAIAHGTRRQWKKSLQELGKIQKFVSAGSALLIPCVLRFNNVKYNLWCQCRLPIALLQISAVGETRWGQGLCASIFSLAMAGLFSGVHFMLEGSSLRSDRVRLLWLEVNARAHNPKDIFWCPSILSRPHDLRMSCSQSSFGRSSHFQRCALCGMFLPKQKFSESSSCLGLLFSQWRRSYTRPWRQL